MTKVKTAKDLGVFQGSLNNTNAMAAVLGKIQEIMMSPDTLNRGDGVQGNDTNDTSFISFCSPGIPIDAKDFDFGDLSTPEQIDNASNFAALVNSIPKATKAWSFTDKKVWDIYEKAITQIKLPRTPLTPGEESQLAAARRYLYKETLDEDGNVIDIEPTLQYLKYEELAYDYRAALRRYNTLLVESTAPNANKQLVREWTRNAASYRQEVTDLYRKWGTFGFRDKVLDAMGIISSVTRRNPQALYDRLNENFNASRFTDTAGGPYFLTRPYPKNVLTKPNWTRFTFNSQQINEFAQKSSSSWSTGGGANFGLWRASASVKRTNQQESYDCDTNGLEIDAEIIQVPLIRSSWLYSLIFWSKNWMWSRPDRNISDGTFPENAGFMPLLPMSMIISRKVSVKMDMSSQSNKAAASSIEASASGGWGPFSVKGNYARSDSSASKDFKHDEFGIYFDGPQIIGFVCDVLPLSPDPDGSLDWEPGFFSSFVDQHFELTKEEVKELNTYEGITIVKKGNAKVKN